MKGIIKMTRQLVLSVNVGSSSVKLALFDMTTDQKIWRETFSYEQPNLVAMSFQSDFKQKLDELPVVQIMAVAHRVVDGGDIEAQVINASWHEWADEQRGYAPLHLPIQLEIIKVMQQLLPDAVHVAVSDNAQFAQLPLSKRIYAIPMQLTTKYQIYKRGAHGLSVDSVRYYLQRSQLDYQRVLIIHLGSGSSLTALDGDEFVDTSMGLTPTTGVVMGTRSEDVDFMVVHELMERAGLSLDEVIRLLNERSGLLGISGGLSSDQRTLLANELSNDNARLAVEVLITSIVGYAAKFITELGGVDAVIFTGGMGENSAEIRRRIVERMAVFGLAVDNNHNLNNEVMIQDKTSRADILIVPANEDRVMVQKVKQVLKR